MSENRCSKCGRCCKDFADLIQLSNEDMAHLRQVNPRVLDYVDESLGDAWMNHLSGEEVYGNCPFLREGSNGYYCEIYKDRPYICRGYPWGKENSICTVPLNKINIEA